MAPQLAPESEEIKALHQQLSETMAREGSGAGVSETTVGGEQPNAEMMDMEEKGDAAKDDPMSES